MANRYANLVGSKKISEDFNNINIGFDRVQDDMDKKAAASSPALTGTPTAPTQPAGDNSTKIATTQYADRAAKTVQTNLDTHVNDKVVHVTQADHDKLGSIEEGAQANQNAFAKVNDIEAADPSDQFYIVGGIGITVTSNPNNGEITVTATGDAAPGAHGSTHTEHGADPIPTATLQEGGLLSAAQLAEIEAQGETMTAIESKLNTATSSTTPNTIVRRDANGRFKASAPSDTEDVARKAEVDAVAAQLDDKASHTDVTNAANAAESNAKAASLPLSGGSVKGALDVIAQFGRQLSVGFFGDLGGVGSSAEFAVLNNSYIDFTTGEYKFKTSTEVIGARGIRFTFYRGLEFFDTGSVSTASDSVFTPIWQPVWHGGNSGPFYRGAGSPEGNVVAPVGSIYQRSDGGANTTLYVKQSGTGNTGWVAK
ncbi:hypothetical protein M3201_18690 [Paenibacillus motobuensis]|uniref:hypothetical protein n=1 Tax=Paenibacillus TaxID=44249 RepID=UPI00204010B1|nr:MULTISPECIES: hypothetical protein [Paenibacillus]MCM3041725.1 hypothetical protein [Paenibacillus lutimineralis]MCM3648829.1 hypothetical protein [Paenibacillus motobuensis]